MLKVESTWMALRTAIASCDVEFNMLAAMSSVSLLPGVVSPRCVRCTIAECSRKAKLTATTMDYAGKAKPPRSFARPIGMIFQSQLAPAHGAGRTTAELPGVESGLRRARLAPNASRSRRQGRRHPSKLGGQCKAYIARVGDSRCATRLYERSRHAHTAAHPPPQRQSDRVTLVVTHCWRCLRYAFASRSSRLRRPHRGRKLPRLTCSRTRSSTTREPL